MGDIWLIYYYMVHIYCNYIIYIYIYIYIVTNIRLISGRCMVAIWLILGQYMVDIWLISGIYDRYMVNVDRITEHLHASPCY